jgi:pyruvate-ferredoxin/flavodoxin oxidoreductase
VDLTEERLRNWRMLEYLSGLHIDRMNEEHVRELEDWREKYQRSNQDRERAIDDIARGMSQLATASSAPADSASGATQVPLPSRSKQEPQTAETGESRDSGLPLVAIADNDLAKCTNCKTCYQDLSELFEKTTIVADGEAKEVSRVIPGVLEKIQITPEIIAKAARVADDCDAEIIQFNPNTPST